MNIVASILTRNRKDRTDSRADSRADSGVDSGVDSSVDSRRGADSRRTRVGGRGTPADGAAEMAATTGPAAVDVGPRHLTLGDGHAAVAAMTGYPPELSLAWPDILLSWPGRLDWVEHIEPIPAATAAAKLRTQRARLESARRLDFDKGRLGDPVTDAAAEDAADLADRVARGSARLFRAGHYLCVHAPAEDELVEAVAEVRAAASSVLLDTHPATWRQLQGWTSTLPLGVDSLRMRRVFDTDALAAAFPLASADLPAPLPGDGVPPGGILYGLNTASNGVVWWNRWAQENHNSVVLARSGAGKSYLVKCEVLRSLYDRVQVSIIDPEDEYLRLCDAVGGTAIQLGVPGVRVNPLDIPPGDRRSDALTRRALFLHTLVAVLLGEQPPPSERAALDKAITATYTAAGINNDPATWTRPAPLLRDLTGILEGAGEPASSTLAARLSPWLSRVSERAHGSGVDAALCARRILMRAGQVGVFVWGGTVPTRGMRRPSR